MGSEYTPTTEEVRAGWMHSGPLASTVVRALQFERWHAEELRKARAEAWEKGYADCYDYHMSDGLAGTEDNPYRADWETEK